MRLIGVLENEKQAFAFYAFLIKEGIKSTYEPFSDPQTNLQQVRVWVYDEDDFETALQLLEEFKKDPNHPKFVTDHLVIPPTPPKELLKSSEKKAEESLQPKGFKIKLMLRQKPAKGVFSLTYFIILLCTFLFLLNSGQQIQMQKKSGKLAPEISLTPLEQNLMFDYPKTNQMLDKLVSENSFESVEDLNKMPPKLSQEFNEIQQIPSWKGVLQLLIDRIKHKKEESGPLFEKIRMGQIWRLFTPCLLHFNFFHILFNMAWAWLLCKQVEMRLKRPKMILLILLIGVVSNVAQYLMSGPYFLGFSGVITGLVGFIWMRQKIAPWEGYPLQKMTILFIAAFVIGMLALEIFSFAFQAFSSKEMTASIANTAHIVGGFFGMLLGRIRLFSRGEV